MRRPAAKPSEEAVVDDGAGRSIWRHGLPAWMLTTKFFLQVLILSMIAFHALRPLWNQWMEPRLPAGTEFACVPLKDEDPYSPGYNPVSARRDMSDPQYRNKTAVMKTLLGAIDACPQGSCDARAHKRLEDNLHAYVSDKAFRVRYFDQESGEDGIRWVHATYSEGGDLTIRSEVEQRVKRKEIDLAKMTPEQRAMFKLAFFKPASAFVPCRK